MCGFFKILEKQAKNRQKLAKVTENYKIMIKIKN